MIDLTPLDVRKKKGDFRRGMRGYDPAEVDQFLEMVADRMEEIVTENLTLRERVDGLLRRVEGQEGREKAVQEALVTAQSLREEMREQSRREAELQMREAEAAAERVVREAEAEAERIRAGSQLELEERRRVLRELERSRTRFLRAYRSLLERESEALEEEESRPAVNDFDVEALSRALPDAASGPHRPAWRAHTDLAAAVRAESGRDVETRGTRDSAASRSEGDTAADAGDRASRKPEPAPLEPSEPNDPGKDALPAPPAISRFEPPRIEEEERT